MPDIFLRLCPRNGVPYDAPLIYKIDEKQLKILSKIIEFGKPSTLYTYDGADGDNDFYIFHDINTYEIIKLYHKIVEKLERDVVKNKEIIEENRRTMSYITDLFIYSKIVNNNIELLHEIDKKESEIDTIESYLANWYFIDRMYALNETLYRTHQYVYRY